MEQDWDLQAVVRGCNTNTNTNINITTTTITSTTATTMSATSMADRSSYFPSLNIKQDDNILPCFPDSFEIRNSIIEEELHQLYKPFFPKSQPLSPQKTHMSNFSVFGGSKDQSLQQYQQLKQSRAGSVATTSTSTATTSSIHSQSTRSKRRKNQQKKVCQVPAEGLSSDVWSWRKYGQKPIKGSPYPRGYYRCSSSKGCLARKQVERNRSDPTMFIITYTAEHNHPVPTHRNSLAGTTRHQKPLTPQPSSPSMAVESNKPLAKPSSCSSTASMEEEVVEQSIKVENREDDGEEENNNNTMEDDEEDELGSFSDMAVTDDFFEGLDEIAGAVPVGGDCFSADPFPASFSLPWMANSNAAAAAGGS